MSGEHDEGARAQRLPRPAWRSGARRGRRAPAAAGRRRRATDQERAGSSSDPGADADDQLRGAPVVGVDQPRGERRDRHRRHAHAGRHQRHRQAAVPLEPRGRGRDHRREEAAGGDADQHAIERAGTRAAGRAAGQHAGQPQQHRPDQHHHARAEAVAQRAPAEAGDAHAQEGERHGAGDAGARPAGVGRDRLQEHGQREHRADGDAGHQRAGGDDGPVAIDLAAAWRMSFIVRPPSGNGLAPGYIDRPSKRVTGMASSSMPSTQRALTAVMATPSGGVSLAIGVDAAGRAEAVPDRVLVEFVDAGVRLRREQVHGVARHEPQQRALALADRAVARRWRGDLALDLELDAPAVAASGSWCYWFIVRPPAPAPATAAARRACRCMAASRAHGCRGPRSSKKRSCTRLSSVPPASAFSSTLTRETSSGARPRPR